MPMKRASGWGDRRVKLDEIPLRFSPEYGRIERFAPGRRNGGEFEPNSQQPFQTHLASTSFGSAKLTGVYLPQVKLDIRRDGRMSAITGFFCRSLTTSPYPSTGPTATPESPCYRDEELADP